MKKRFNRCGRLCAVLSIIFSIFITGNLSAQNTPWSTGTANGGDLNLYLVTIEPGDKLYSWWGHSALIVEDIKGNVRFLYNYGLFSFRRKNIANFIKGNLFFEVGAMNAAFGLSLYRDQNREIRMQVLNLPPKKKLEMALFLDNNILPENREYLYHHYDDNCATRLRDLIDTAIDGQLADKTKNQNIPRTLRDFTHLYTYRHFFMDTLLMFILGQEEDGPTTQWNAMFLPSELEKSIEAIEYYTGENKQKLVSRSYTYFQSKDRAAVPQQAPATWPFSLLIGIGLSGMCIGTAVWMKKNRPGGRIFFGIYQILLGFVYGIPGTVLFIMSLFTNHTVTYFNENLLLANPLTLLLIPIGFGLIFKHDKGLKWLSITWIIILMMNLILLILKAIPAFYQQNWIFIGMVLPVSLSSVAANLFILKDKRK